MSDARSVERSDCWFLPDSASRLQMLFGLDGLRRARVIRPFMSVKPLLKALKIFLKPIFQESYSVASLSVGQFQVSSAVPKSSRAALRDGSS